MQRSMAFEQGWLRSAIKSSVEDLVKNPRVSQTQKDAFRDAAQKLEQSTLLKRPAASAAAVHHSVTVTPDA
jgi:hypothetical protein